MEPFGQGRTETVFKYHRDQLHTFAVPLEVRVFDVRE